MWIEASLSDKREGKTMKQSIMTVLSLVRALTVLPAFAERDLGGAYKASNLIAREVKSP